MLQSNHVRSHRLKSEVSFPNWKLEGIKIDRSTQTAPTDADAQGIVLVIFEKYCNKICSKYEFQVLAFYQNFAWARNWLFQSVFILQLNSFRPIDVGIEKTDLPKSYSQTVHCFTTYEIHVANWILYILSWGENILLLIALIYSIFCCI